MTAHTRTVTRPPAPGLPVDDDAAAHAALMRDAFSAASRRGASELRLTLGGRTARLRTAGPTVTAYAHRAFAHLAGGDGGVDLAIDLWDEHETGVGCSGCAVDDALDLNAAVSVSSDGRYVRIRRARSDVTYDRKRRVVVGWSDFGGRVQLGEQGRPLQAPLAFWHCDIGMQVMHAGLVARGGAGVLFPGMGGSGKSTSSLCCLGAGLNYLGDDYIALERSADGRHIGHGLYGSCFLEPDHLRRFPRLAPHAISSSFDFEDKSLVMLHEVFPGQLTRSAQIRAIALPTIVDAPASSWGAASPGQALLALAPSSIVMVPGKGAAELEPLADLVRAVPCFRLELGRDLATIPRCVEEILDEVTGR